MLPICVLMALPLLTAKRLNSAAEKNVAQRRPGAMTNLADALEGRDRGLSVSSRSTFCFAYARFRWDGVCMNLGLTPSG